MRVKENDSRIDSGVYERCRPGWETKNEKNWYDRSSRLVSGEHKRKQTKLQIDIMTNELFKIRD